MCSKKIAGEPEKDGVTTIGAVVNSTPRGALEVVLMIWHVPASSTVELKRLNSAEIMPLPVAKASRGPGASFVFVRPTPPWILALVVERSR